MEQGKIPVIDFASWRSDSTPEQRKAIATSLTNACRDIGWAYIVNHQISPEKLSEAFQWSKKLFDLGLREKMLAPHPPGPTVHRGYSWPGLEKVSQVNSDKEDLEMEKKLREVGDCKESYEIGSEHNTEQPNIWLPEHVLPGFRSFMQDFYWQCHRVSQTLLSAIAIGLGQEEDDDFLPRFHSGLNNQLRLLHYPPVPAAALESGKQARMPAHTDWGTITMLFQDDCGGLQVQDPRHEEKFVDATPVANAIIMNVGDLLMRWSNDKLKSTMHRVTLPPLQDRITGAERMTKERYSIPYFVSVDPEACVECLSVCTDPANPPKYPPVIEKDYRAFRGRLQYSSAPETVST